MSLTLDLFKDVIDIPNVRAITEVVNGETVTIISYMIATPNIWEYKYGRESRGITFDSNGKCICRPFEKFFNLNENKYSLEEDFNTDDMQVMDKLDGSMLIACLIKDNVYFKTNKSFFSEVAISATNDASSEIKSFCKQWIIKGFTPIFEYINPKYGIVIDYSDTDYVNFNLLALRNIKTGEYFDIKEAYNNEIPNMKNVKFSKMSLNDMKEKVITSKGIEGWVVKTKNQGYFKIKTQWYLNRHRLTNFNERRIGDMIINGTIDDILPYIPQNMKEQFSVIESKTNSLLSDQLNKIKFIAEQRDKFSSMKEFVEEFKTDKNLFYAINYINNKLDIEKLWKNRCRKELDNTKKIFWIQELYPK